jgi:LuxR family maltose regulon positive regulatory protein
MGEYLQQLLNALDEGRPRAATDLATVLTQQEARILGKLQSPLSNRELADSLFITEGTLKWHLKNIYAKLGVTSRVAAIAVSRARGLLSG